MSAVCSRELSPSGVCVSRHSGRACFECLGCSMRWGGMFVMRLGTRDSHQACIGEITTSSLPGSPATQARSSSLENSGKKVKGKKTAIKDDYIRYAQSVSIAVTVSVSFFSVWTRTQYIIPSAPCTKRKSRKAGSGLTSRLQEEMDDVGWVGGGIL